MCGIAVRNVKRSDYYKGEMKHRGIISYEKEYGNIQLIHEHLPIQSFDYDYPIIETEKYIVLFNGEIFDHNEKDDLVYLKDLFSHEVPIKTILSEILEKDGFYSFIIIDKEKNKVYAFTDPLGKKQLYYRPNFGIASEIRGIEWDNKLDWGYFGTIKKFGYNIDNRTPLIKTKRIMPNCFYTFDIELNLIGIKENLYDFFTRTLPCKDPETFIYETIDQSVKNRLIGHKKIALLLSGGLDSSIIHHHLGNADVAKYTVPNKSDYEHALKLCPDVKLINFKEGDFRIPLRVMEMPIDLGSMVPQFYLCQAIDETVIITGDGSDEIFGGYKRMFEYDAQISDIFDELPFYHLIRLDRMSMWFTKELRSPFLNLDLIRFALTIPYKDRIDKKILRKTYENVLPNYIINRPKEALKINKVEISPQSYRGNLISSYIEQHAIKQEWIYSK